MTEKPKAFRKVRKELAEKMASDPLEVDRSELDSAGRRIWCSAEGCPMRASTYFGAALCSWHDKADSHDWPRVTAELVETRAAGRMPTRPPIRQVAWVGQAAARIKARRAAAGDVANPFAAVAARMQALRPTPRGLDDDAANALLREVS